jgi:hypothetical protein
MEVFILNTTSDKLIPAFIRKGKLEELPSISNSWIFNFRKASQINGKTVFVLVCEETGNILEGCMIFSIHETFGPYMDLLEVAPHNKGNHETYKDVAGCLIAYACGLSFELGQNENKGILTFEAYGKFKESKENLLQLYTSRYGASQNPFGYLEIYPEQGRLLIEKYLKIT